MSTVHRRRRERQGTEVALASEVLLEGEWGYATDSGKTKIGDGVTVWSELPYAGLEGPPGDGVDTLPELAAGVGTTLDTSDPDFIGVDAAARMLTQATAANTTAETTIGSLSLPAGAFALLPDAIYGRLHVGANVVNNSGQARDVTVRVRLDDQTVGTAALAGVAAGSGTRSLALDMTIAPGAFAGTRVFGSMSWVLGAPGGGTGVAGAAVPNIAATFDLDEPMDLTVTAQMSAASEQLTAEVSVGWLTLIRVAA